MQRRSFLHRTLATLAGASLPARIFAADTPGNTTAAAGNTTTAPAPLTASSSTALQAAVARLYQLGRRNVAIHDPSAIVKCGSTYWIFYTGNRSYHSADLLNWYPGPAVLTEPFPWFDTAVPGFRGTSFWAPDCLKVGDRYFLFYAISAFGKNTSAIGLVTNPTLDPADPAFKWTDQGMIIQSVATDNFNCIDPAACFDADGNLWMAFGSFWSGIKLIALDKATGHRLPGTPMYTLAANHAHATATDEGALTDPINHSQIEASYLFHHDNFYYLFVNWGLCCHGLSSTYNIRVGRSDKITGPYLDKNGKNLDHDGGTLFFADDGPVLDTSSYPAGRRGPPPPHVHALIGPGQSGIFFEDGKYWFSCHYYDGTTPTGASILSIRPLTWDASGWPVLGEYPAPAPIPTVSMPSGHGRRGGFGGGFGGGQNGGNNAGTSGNTPPPATPSPATSSNSTATPAAPAATN